MNACAEMEESCVWNAECAYMHISCRKKPVQQLKVPVFFQLLLN